MKSILTSRPVRNATTLVYTLFTDARVRIRPSISTTFTLPIHRTSRVHSQLSNTSRSYDLTTLRHRAAAICSLGVRHTRNTATVCEQSDFSLFARCLRVYSLFIMLTGLTWRRYRRASLQPLIGGNCNRYCMHLSRHFHQIRHLVISRGTPFDELPSRSKHVRRLDVPKTCKRLFTLSMYLEWHVAEGGPSKLECYSTPRRQFCSL